MQVKDNYTALPESEQTLTQYVLDNQLCLAGRLRQGKSHDRTPPAAPN